MEELFASVGDLDDKLSFNATTNYICTEVFCGSSAMWTVCALGCSC